MILFIFSIMMYTAFDVYHDVRDIIRHEPPRDPRAKAKSGSAGEESAS